MKLFQDDWCVAEIKLSYHPQKRTGIIVTCAADAHSIFKAMWDMELIDLQEQFSVLCLDNKNEVIGFRVISTGTATKAIVDIQLLVSCCLLCRAQQVIIAHNHPSGNLKASTADKRLTDKLKWQLIDLEIKLLDHLILTRESYMSFADTGIFKKVPSV